MFIGVGPIDLYEERVNRSIGLRLRGYQRHIAREIMDSLDSCGRCFIAVSMPTGSGKTLVEGFLGFFWGFFRGSSRVLVVEPTRFLCDQMYLKVWRPIFGDAVVKDYEGRCGVFSDAGARIILSTPKTSLKCVSSDLDIDLVVVDEVHHLFGNQAYRDMILKLKPRHVVGFTALIPSSRMASLDPELSGLFDEVRYLHFDFRRLREIDEGFNPPRAVMDIFDSELNDLEDKVYNLLFTGSVKGNLASIKFLERTLISYGKEAFCESFWRMVDRSLIYNRYEFNKLCRKPEPSHKARTLISVLRAYGFSSGLSDISPVMIFTSRVATAHEFRRVICSEFSIDPESIAMLVGRVDRDRRLEIVRGAAKGDYPVIISTLVGEEGIDLPEAKLLVMTDVKKNPLRFYQRIGRLIRGSRSGLKYLVAELTPKTFEYDDLDTAIDNLYSEGVDVSFILLNIDEKKSTSRIVDLVSRVSATRSIIPIPYTLLAFDGGSADPIEIAINVIKSSDSGLRSLESIKREMIDNGYRYVDDAELIKDFLTDLGVKYTYRVDEKAKKTLFRVLDSGVIGSSLGRQLYRAILEGSLIYIYNIDKLSSILSDHLYRLIDKALTVGKLNTVSKESIRIDLKSLAALLLDLFPPSHLDTVRSKLNLELARCRETLDKVANPLNIKVSFHVNIFKISYSARQKFIPAHLYIDIELPKSGVSFGSQINYYSVSSSMLDLYMELAKLNLSAVACRSVEMILQDIIESLDKEDSRYYPYIVSIL